MTVDFSDLDDLDSAPTRDERPTEKVEQTVRCHKCRGSGQTRWGQCFPCKGTGLVSIHHEKRHAAYIKGRNTAAANKPKRAQAWREENAIEAAWITAAAGRGFAFAGAMDQAIEKYGSLTENQLTAVRKLIAQDAQRLALQAERTAEVAGASTIRDSLNRAHERGLKKPKLLAGGISFERPREGTKNPGCVYVVRAGDYLGKIDPNGMFVPGFKCSEEDQAAVMQVAADPLAAAVAHGRLTGNCACCGRALKDPKSVAAGIGPVCQDKFFGA